MKNIILKGLVLSAMLTGIIVSADDGSEMVVISSKRFKVEHAAKKVMDGGIQVVSLNPASKGWDVHLPFSGNISPGTYTARVLIKIVGGNSKGYGVRFAVFNPKTNKCPYKLVVKATSIANDNKYHWLSLNKITIPDVPKAYFFISCYGDNSFKKCLIKSIEFYPEKK